VLWRKRSFGAQSDRGNRFAERLMTVAHTARKQRKDVLGFLGSLVEAAAAGRRTLRDRLDAFRADGMQLGPAPSASARARCC
jgi:hypothetical protein